MPEEQQLLEGPGLELLIGRTDFKRYEKTREKDDTAREKKART